MRDTITFLDRVKMIKFIATTKKFTSGENVKAFEREWNSWLGSKFSLFVSSGSTANLLLIASVMEKYGIKPGDKVLLPACTWMTNVAPIMQLGLTPIFCDINLDNFSFNVKNMKSIAIQHPDIKIVFVTHLLGLPADNDTYAGIFPNAIILDDVCESHGARLADGKRVGSNSIGATFSFYFGHHMTTVEGGIVSTNDHELYDIMKMKRSHGLARESEIFDVYASMYAELDKSFLFITDGYNFRNHEICAVLGRSQLKRLDRTIEARKLNYRNFINMLRGHDDKFYVPTASHLNSSFCFPMVAKSRSYKLQLQELLDANNIEHRPVVGGNLLRQPFISGKYELAYPEGAINADIVNDNGLYIGNNQFVTVKDIDRLDSILSEIVVLGDN